MSEVEARDYTVEVLLSEDAWAQHLSAETRRGLADSPPWTSPVWFYDERGSQLFDEITTLPEYYPTRAEREILAARSGEIAALAGASTLVELGAGSADKTRLLLRALREQGTLERFVPVDVSLPALAGAAATIVEEFPGVEVRCIVSDFVTQVPHLPREGRRTVAFLGSTIGNMDPAMRAAFLADVATHLRPGDTFLLGTDLVKSPERLVAAYDDARGVTAAFNLNVLAVLNRRLGSAFDVAAFEHAAVWDSDASRIEMRLVAREPQDVAFPELDGQRLRLDAGQWLRTEISTKFRPEQVSAELAAAGLDVVATWTDAAGDFALTLAAPR